MHIVNIGERERADIGVSFCCCGRVVFPTTDGEVAMSAKLSGRVFEWLLASWSGHEEHPEEVFPELQGASLNQLDHELEIAIRDAEQVESVVL